MKICKVCQREFFRNKKGGEAYKVFEGRKFCSKSCANSFNMNKNAEDITGQKFNYLTAIEKTREKKRGGYLWVWQCECGNIKKATTKSIKYGTTKSCGCYKLKVNSTYGKKVGGKNKTHGHGGTRFYNIWHCMKTRTSDPDSNRKHIYQDRGIIISKEWEDFMNFYQDMHSSYKDHVLKYGEKNTSLDRIDGNKNYSKENCRWATAKEQARNMRVNRMITYTGETKCLAEWAEIYNINYGSCWKRLKLGWSIEKALTTPVKKLYV